MNGTVYLVGAGPGDPGLITVKGLRVLERADVVLYDRLVCRELLDHAPIHAERIFAGKRPGFHALSQDRINELLVERARSGLTVVRLKGGDPFVFGRGGEEAIACARAGVRCNVVPGVTSVVASPAVAGIPLTHRGIGGTFAVVTAHMAVEGATPSPDWAALARIDTIVVLMGVRRLRAVADELLAGGRGADTPVAIVERASTPAERVTTGCLGTIANIARVAGVQAPATIVIGEVVNIREAVLRESAAARRRHAVVDAFADAV